MGPIEDMALVSSTQTPAVKALSCVYIMFPFNGKDLDISSAGRVAVEVHFLGVVIAATGSNTSLYHVFFLRAACSSSEKNKFKVMAATPTFPVLPLTVFVTIGVPPAVAESGYSLKMFPLV